MTAGAMARGSAASATRPEAWYVCLTKPRQELIARDRLLEQGYEVYVPQLARWVRHSRGWHLSRSALFPRYAFVRPTSPGQSVAPVRSTGGVTTLVSFGPQLARLSNDRLQALRELMIKAEASSPGQPFDLGINVVFAAGPLKGLSGIVSSVADERVMVMLSLLGATHRVAVPADHLAVA